MKNKINILAFIPARGGSKSIPLKNLSKINNKPLLFYTLNLVTKFRRVFDKIICSTDNEKIKRYIKKFDIDYLCRPKSISRDSSSTESSILHCLNYLNKEKKYFPDLIFLFQPTSPFVMKEHINKLLDLAKDKEKFDSILTISKIQHNSHAYNQRYIFRNYVEFIFKKEREEMFNKQKKPKFYKFGNLICINTKSFLKTKKIFGKKNLWVEIEDKYSVDIETVEDLNYATYLIKSKQIIIK